MDTLVEAVNATAKIPLHPYSPLNAALPEYVTNTLSSRTLVASFVVGSIAIFAVTLLFINSAPRKLSKGEIFVTLWFALCGCIHFFFEGKCFVQAKISVMLTTIRLLCRQLYRSVQQTQPFRPTLERILPL